MNNKLTTFAFYFWSADAEDQNKKIPEYWLLEYSTTYFFLLERDKPGRPSQLGLCLVSLFCAYPMQVVYSASEPITLICLFHEQFFFSFLIDFSLLAQVHSNFKPSICSVDRKLIDD